MTAPLVSFGRDIRTYLLGRLLAIELGAVLDDGVTGEHTGVLVPEDWAEDVIAGKTMCVGAATTTLVWSPIRPLCNVDILCPAKACLVLNVSLHNLQAKPDHMDGLVCVRKTDRLLTACQPHGFLKRQCLLPKLHGCKAHTPPPF